MPNPSPCSRLRPKDLSRAFLVAGLAGLAQSLIAQPVAAPAASTPSHDVTVKLDVFNVGATRGQNYGASNMASATRMNTPIENVPQAMNVVNSNLLADIGANSFDQAVRYTPGITQRQNSPDGAIVRGLA